MTVDDHVHNLVAFSPITGFVVSTENSSIRSILISTPDKTHSSISHFDSFNVAKVVRRVIMIESGIDPRNLWT